MTITHTAASGHAGHAGHAGHGGHHDHVAQFRRLFWVMLVLAIPTVALSGMFAMILGYKVPEFPGAPWVSPVLGTVMYFWGGRPFLTGAISEIRSRTPGMMLLIGLAITVAFVSSWGASLGVLDHQLDFWWELALLIVIMLLGHWIEMRSLAQTSSALDSLAALLPDEAERVEGDDIVTVAPSDLRVGDVVIVRPGGSVPADGEIVDGSADINESMVTGESVPVRRGVGEHVVAGTVATDSGLRVEVTAVGDDTALAGIQRLVTEAQNSSSRAQRLADIAAGWLFWFALGAAVITAVVWGVVGRPEEAVIRTITVLVIACPHALGLAIPLVVSIATERAARAGVLVKDRLALESMRTVGAVLFDKTGTLTKGEPTVTRWPRRTGRSETDVLALAAAAEADSEHPLARAIVGAARVRICRCPAASDFSSSPAVGVTATVDGRQVRVGGPRLLEEAGQAELADTRPWHGEGAIVLHVAGRRGRGGRAQAGRRSATGVASGRRRPAPAGHQGGDDHRGCRTGGAGGRRRPRHRSGVRGRAARGQGGQGRRAAGRGPQGRDGRRRRQRRAGAGPGRRRHRHRRGHRRRDRLGRRDPRQLGPAFGAVGHHAVESDIPQDAAKPLVGSGLQLDRGSAGGRCACADRVRDADVGRCAFDVGVDGGRRAQRATVAAAGSAAADASR